MTPYLGKIARMALTLSDAHSNKSRSELVEEIMRLNRELRARNEEIAMLKKRILLYKSIK